MLKMIQNGKKFKSHNISGHVSVLQQMMNYNFTMNLVKRHLFIKDLIPVSIIRSMVCPMVSLATTISLIHILLYTRIVIRWNIVMEK